MNSKDNPEIFLAVVQSNKGIIYKIVNTYCKDTEDRKDLVQEIIIQLWRSFERYNAKYEYSTWIYKIALNVAISSYWKESRRIKLMSPITESILFFDDTAGNTKNEDISLLQKLIQELKELDRALMLLYLDERSYKEISEIIGITETNVASKISRIKKGLKLRFEKFNTSY